MKPTSTMTVKECQHELALLGGWTFIPDGRGAPYFKQVQGVNYSLSTGPTCLPVPATLDEAAKLPEGWGFTIEYGNPPEPHVAAFAYASPTQSVRAEGTTELEARLRLRVEVERSLREGGKEKQQ